MRKLIITALLMAFAAVLLVSCRNSRSGPENISSDAVINPNSATGKGDFSKLPAFSFEETDHDFGRVIEGESVAFDFEFTNTGKTELVIADVSTSCGCTVTEYPRNPIMPGDKGKINVKFNSAGKRGYQNKSIVIAANTQPNTTVLHIRAQVVSAGGE